MSFNRSGGSGKGTSYFPLSKKSTSTTINKTNNGGRGKQVLTSANRFPYSSTPAVSPRVKVDDNDNKEPIKKSAGDDSKREKENCSASSSSNSVLLNTSSVQGHQCPSENQSIIMEVSSPREVGTFSSSNKASIYDGQPLSPIIPNEGRRRIHYSIARGISLEEKNEGFEDSQFSATMRSMLTAGLIDRSRRQETEDILHILKTTDRSAIRSNNIKLLQRLVQWHIADEAATSRITEDQKYRFDESSALYEFPSSWIPGSCGTASHHLFHLLFQCYDFNEASARFRNDWPLYDKKIESGFRREVAKWLKEIVQIHPEFFDKVKVESLSSFIVNPGGDRFLHLIDSLILLVMHKKLCIGALPQGLCQVQLPKTQNVENSVKQVLFLLHQIGIINQETIKLSMQTSKINVSKKQRLRKTDAQLAEFKSRLHQDITDFDQLCAALHKNFSSALVDQPNVLMLEEIPPQLSSLFKICNADPPKLHCADVASLFQRLKELMRRVRVEGNSLALCHDKFNPLWHILEKEKKVDNALDVGKLFYSITLQEHSLSAFANSVKEVLLRLWKNTGLVDPASVELIRQFKDLDLKFKYTKDVGNKLKDKRNVIPDILFNYDGCLNSENTLSDIDWSTVSQLKLPSISLLSQDQHEVPVSNTGQTPRIANFLQGIRRKEYETTTTTAASTAIDFSSNTLMFQSLGIDICSEDPLSEQMEFLHLKSVISTSHSTRDTISECVSTSTPITRYRKQIGSHLPIPTIKTPICSSNSKSENGKNYVSLSSSDSKTPGLGTGLGNLEEGDISADRLSNDGSFSELPLSTRKRISGIMESLLSGSPSTNFSELGNQWSRRSSNSSKRNSSSASNSQRTSLNKSLRNSWDQEKGILETSFVLLDDEFEDLEMY